MLTLVPFTGGWWIMGDRDGQLSRIGEGLELLLPQAIADPVGPTPIGGNQQVGLAGIQGLPPLLPPATNTGHRKLSGVMVHSDIDEPWIVDEVVDAIGNGLAIGQREKIIPIVTLSKNSV